MAYVDSERYRQQLVRDGERRFREWHSRFLAYQRRFLQEMGLLRTPQPPVPELPQLNPVPASESVALAESTTRPTDEPRTMPAAENAENVVSAAAPESVAPVTETASEPEEPIDQNLWWVVPGRLGGVRKPTATELPILQSAGIGAIVSLTDDPGNLDLYAAHGIPHLWLPVKGGTAPTREQLEAFGEFVAAENSAGRGVAVHCSSGRRRTGTFLAAWLVCKGSSAEAAIAAIQSANPAVELREAQVNFLHELAASR